MLQIIFKPELYRFSDCETFARDMQIGKGDLVISNQFIYEPSFGELKLTCDVLYQEKYGAGEPSDDMVEAICADIAKLGEHRRIIGIGGGTVLDICKLLGLSQVTPVTDLYDRKLPIVKNKEVILVPTTCGTGSEVTNISILAFNKRQTKSGLAVNELYADKAVLVPELVKNLPYRFFATSSIDALIHAVESSLSPKATPYTRLFGYRAVEMILRGYQKIAAEGPDARLGLLDDFMTASNFAGLAFGTAGCGAVHAMSYPLGGTFHVAHGEANYAIFAGVIECYLSHRQDGAIRELACLIGSVLGCPEKDAFAQMFLLLDQIISRKSLKEYGATQDRLKDWTQKVITGQTRLMQNNFIALDSAQVLGIYQNLYE